MILGLKVGTKKVPKKNVNFMVHLISKIGYIMNKKLFILSKRKDGYIYI